MAGEANIPKALGFLRLLLTAVHVTEKYIFSVRERAAAFSDNEKAAARLCFQSKITADAVWIQFRCNSDTSFCYPAGMPGTVNADPEVGLAKWMGRKGKQKWI